MEFRDSNDHSRLYVKAYLLESEFDYKEAKKKYELLWSLSYDDYDRYFLARILAAYQNSFEDQLDWWLTALEYWVKLDREAFEGVLPSLYFEIGETYENLMDFKNAKAHYLLGSSFLKYLPGGDMAKWVIEALADGIERMNKKGF